MGTQTSLFGRSEVRRAILRLFFARPGVEQHVRDVARSLGRSAPAVSRELRRLEDEGILRSRTIGPIRLYRVNAESPIAEEVRRLVQRTIGVEAVLRDALGAVPGLEEALLFGSYAKRTERATSDLDVLVIGDVDRERLSERLVDAEQLLKRDINVIAYGRKHLERLRRARDPFVLEVLSGPRVPLVKRLTRSR